MKIKFNKKQAAELSCLFEEPFNFSSSNLRFQSFFEINLHKYPESDLKVLENQVHEKLDIRGMKAHAVDLKIWFAISQDPEYAKSTKIRSLDKAPDVFYLRMKDMPRKHIYKNIADGDESRRVAYFVERIKYTSADKYMQAHITFHLAYILNGVVCEQTLSMYADQVTGKTCDTCLAEFRFSFENSIIRDDYEFEVSRYETIVEQIGTQFLGSGLADDEDVDGNNSGGDSWWRRTQVIRLDKDGEKAKVVIDIVKEEDKETRKAKNTHISSSFWNSRKDEDGEVEESTQIEIPVHPYVTIFDLRRHMRLRTHIGNLEEYIYNESIREKLVIPDEHQMIVDCLLEESQITFQDVVANKSGGIIILSQGPPGTGKTLTAEIYAEALKRPLYTVQCSQLGLDSGTLEKNLIKVLMRGKRWDAVTLLDEADVYVHQRGTDLEQNAIVGVFLRILEYHTGVLFLTTNRGDLVDDAILSRCTVRIPYDVPTPENQKKIWCSLSSANGVGFSAEQIDEIVAVHNDLSGRDIKNLLKLSLLIFKDAKKIDSGAISKMRIYKATTKVQN